MIAYLNPSHSLIFPGRAVFLIMKFVLTFFFESTDHRYNLWRARFDAVPDLLWTLFAPDLNSFCHAAPDAVPDLNSFSCSVCGSKVTLGLTAAGEPGEGFN